jgi:hypothetical protein
MRTLLLASLLVFPLAAPALAQDVVTLHSVTIDANDDVTVVYSKNFATCAHLRFSDPTCALNGPLTHVANLFCTQGANVAVTVPLTSFVAGFAPETPVFLVHGNNGNVRSACVTVECDGAYGNGCAGLAGVPVLDALDDCPPAGGSLDLLLAGAAPSSLAVLGFGLVQTTVPLFGCNLLIGAVQGTVVVVLDGSGAGSFSLPLPPGIAGFTFPTQAFVLDAGGPQGFSATNGLLVRVR